MKTLLSKRAEKNHKYGDVFHALCPYFAMFPPEFAKEAILKYSKPHDLVIDPFSGRGTTLLEARLLNREIIANDINPVAVTITRAKANRLDLKKCLNIIKLLEKEYHKSSESSLKKEAEKLPIFFHKAYSPKTLLQVLWLRKKFYSVKSPEKIFVKTLCLGYLHGEAQKKKQIYFSNNLPHTYCPKPDYSVRFWENRGMIAPDVNVFDILANRCVFRLKDSTQGASKIKGHCILGDVREIHKNVKKITNKKVQLVITSPPYLKITSYEQDQWLRLWFLGDNPYPSRCKITKDDQITSVGKYVDFLADSWKSIGKIMKKNGYIVCRIGQSAKDNFPLTKIMEESIKKSGQNFDIIECNFSPFKKIRQAKMFGGSYKDSGEYDFIMRVN